MKIKYSNKKRIIVLKKPSNRTLHHEQKGQMIVLMGILLALSVLVIGSFATELSTLNVSSSSARSNTLLKEFIHIKETFGLALNYNLVDISFDDPNFVFEGEFYSHNVSYPKINNVVEKTSNLFREMELKHNKIFSATYEALDYSHRSSQGNVYYVRVLLSLKDLNGLIIEPVMFSIVCKESI